MLLSSLCSSSRATSMHLLIHIIGSSAISRSLLSKLH